jgi:hypothetical protein
MATEIEAVKKALRPQQDFARQQPALDPIQQKSRELSTKITGIRWKMQGASAEQMGPLKQEEKKLESELNELLKQRVMGSTPAVTPSTRQAQIATKAVHISKEVHAEASQTLQMGMAKGEARYEQKPAMHLKNNLFLTVHEVNAPKSVTVSYR